MENVTKLDPRTLKMDSERRAKVLRGLIDLFLKRAIENPEKEADFLERSQRYELELNAILQK